MSADRKTWPMMVRVGLWGLPNRQAACFFIFLALVCAAACVAYGLVDPRWFAGGLFVFAALWYYLAIRWVDQHDGWSTKQD